MRNTTKLKHILKKFSVCIDIDEEEKFTLNLVDKTHPENMHTIEADSYSKVVSKAFGFLKKADVKKKFL